MPTSTPIKYKIYKGSDKGKPYYQVLPGTNIPFGMTESTYQEAKTFLDTFGTGSQYGYKDTSPIQGLAEQLQKVQSGQIASYSDVAAPWGERLANVPVNQYSEMMKGNWGISPQEFKEQNIRMAAQPQQPTGLAGEIANRAGQPSGYAGPSIVDYLKSVNQPSDYGSRSKLAEQYGIKDYAGTAEQNTSILNILRGQGGGGAGNAPTGATGALGGVLGGGTGSGVSGGKSAYDLLIEQLMGGMGTALTGATGAETTGLEKTVGDFNTEISKANDLLYELDQKIRGDVLKEENRLAPIDIIGQMQKAIAGALDPTRQDLLSTLSKLTEGKSNALEALGISQNKKANTLQELQAQTNLLKTLEEMKEPNESVIDSFTDASGNRIAVFYDKKTSKTRTESLGKVGTTSTTKNTFSSGGMTVPDSAIASGQTKLDESRGSDNYSNSALYLQMLAAWKKDGGLEQDFFTQFPPKNYLNPNDTSIPQYIKDKLKASSSFDNL